MVAGQCEALLSMLSVVQTELSDPVTGLKTISGAFVDMVYTDEALQLYLLIIAEQQFPVLGELVYRSGPESVLQQLSTYLDELKVRGMLSMDNIETSSRLFFGMLKGDHHFRCLLGLQFGLSDAEKRQLIGAAVSLFLKGHGYDL